MLPWTTDSRAAGPSEPVGCQVPPVPVLVYATLCPVEVWPATTKPSLVPLTTPGLQPAAPPIVPAYCHASPFGEK